MQPADTYNKALHPNSLYRKTIVISSTDGHRFQRNFPTLGEKSGVLEGTVWSVMARLLVWVNGLCLGGQHIILSVTYYVAMLEQVGMYT